MICLENNYWMFSDEYKKMIENISQITKDLSPEFFAMSQNNLQLSSILETNINPEMLSTVKEFKNQMVDFIRLSKQLSELTQTFQLSEEMKEFIQVIKESESLSEEKFEKKYGEEFEICRTLGEHGWVVSGHSNPRYIKNWYKALIEDRIEEIIYFFEKDEDCVIKSITISLERKYNDPVNRNYYSRGIKAFQDNDYMTSAMYLVGLLETRVNALVQFPPRTKYREKFSDKGLKTVRIFSFRSRLFKVIASEVLSPLSIRNSETCFSMINLLGFILSDAFHFKVGLYDIFKIGNFLQIIFFQIRDSESCSQYFVIRLNVIFKQYIRFASK